MDYYNILNIPKNASQDEIKKSYRVLSSSGLIIGFNSLFFNSRFPIGVLHLHIKLYKLLNFPE